VQLLQEYGLISEFQQFGPTLWGDMVSQYYIKIDTARMFMDVPAKAKISEIVRPKSFFFVHRLTRCLALSHMSSR
jgi:hypothetical protein